MLYDECSVRLARLLVTFLELETFSEIKDGLGPDLWQIAVLFNDFSEPGNGRNPLATPQIKPGDEQAAFSEDFSDFSDFLLCLARIFRLGRMLDEFLETFQRCLGK